jgi:tryptophanyl-tRNA synthetase
VVDTFAPIRERTAKYLADTDGLDALLADGARRAREIAGQTMVAVRDRCGFLPLSS